MEYTIRDIGASKKELAVNIGKEEWEKYVQEAYAKNKYKYVVEGFRKGKVPMSVLVNRYGIGYFYEDALDLALDACYTEILDKEDLKVIASPDVDLKGMNADGVSFVITVTVEPDFELGQYKGLTFTKDSVEVTDEEVEEEIKKELEQRARMIEKDTPAENGDTVIIDYSGSIDGVKFDGGTAEKQSLELGSGTFIPGFEDQVVGMSKEEEKDIDVTFPQDYGSQELAGKAAVFHIKVHEVQKKEVPVLDDEFVKDVDEELDTVEQWKEKIKARILDKKAKNAEIKLQNEIIERIADNTTIDIPECMIEEELDAKIKEFEYSLTQYGLKLKDYLQYTGSSIEKMKEEQREEAIRNIKIRLVLQKICKVENITVSAEDFQDKLKDVPPEQIKQAMDYFANQILTEKLLAFLMENNEIR